LPEISLLDIYLTKRIPQNFLLTERDFERYAQIRGLDISQTDLEFFEELGLLFPLCRVELPVTEELGVLETVKAGKKIRKLILLKEGDNWKGKIERRYAGLFNISHTLNRWYESDFCKDPAKTEFRPWKEYKDGYYETARALYHPWQFINLRAISHFLGYRISVPHILEEEKFRRIKGNVGRF